jgi:hypothetical protein
MVQNTLFECQSQRRILSQQISLINESLKEIYSELIQTKRDNPKYVQLTILENKSLQEQSKITEQLNIIEKQEHDYFAQLATSIKEYHDCQVMNTQKYKYLSILASSFIAIFSITISIIYNNKRISDIKNAINEGELSIQNTFKTEFLKFFNNQANQNVKELNVQELNNYKWSKTEQIAYIVGFGTLIYLLSQIINS